MAISMRIKHCGAIAARGSEGVKTILWGYLDIFTMFPYQIMNAALKYKYKEPSSFSNRTV